MRSACYGCNAIRNAVSAIVAEAVGAGIEGNSARSDADTAALINTAFFAANLDAEGCTDFRGMTAAAVLAEIVDGEAFFVAEHWDSGTGRASNPGGVR